MADNLSLRYDKKRMEEKMTFADYIGIRGGNPISMLNLMASQLWNEEEKDWVDFDEAKEIILVMPMEWVNEFVATLAKDAELTKLFGTK